MVSRPITTGSGGGKGKGFFAKKGGGKLQRLGFSIARFWGKDPLWFDELDPDLRSLLIADYQMAHQKPKTQKLATKEELARRIEQFQNRGVSNG